MHIWANYVFDDLEHKPYHTKHGTHPISAHGKIKPVGEQEVLRYASEAVVIRTAWLYSPIMDIILLKLCAVYDLREIVNVVADQIGTPTYVSGLSKAIVQVPPQMNKLKSDILFY